MCCQSATSQGLGSKLCVRSGRKKVAPECKEDRRVASVHGLYCIHSVVAMLAWRFEIKLCSQVIEKRRGRPLPNAHRAIALNIAMTANRAQPGPRLSDLSAQQHEVNDLLDVGNRIAVLSQSHGPAEYSALRLHENPRCLFNPGLKNSTLLNDLTPVHFSKRRCKLFKSRRVLTDKLLIEHLIRSALLFGEHIFHDPFQQSYVPIDTHLQEQVRQSGSTAEQSNDILRMLETGHADFWQRIDMNELAAIQFRLLQRR